MKLNKQEGIYISSFHIGDLVMRTFEMDGIEICLEWRTAGAVRILNFSLSQKCTKIRNRNPLIATLAACQRFPYAC